MAPESVGFEGSCVAQTLGSRAPQEHLAWLHSRDGNIRAPARKGTVPLHTHTVTAPWN